jgi:hypothetical protein
MLQNSRCWSQAALLLAVAACGPSAPRASVGSSADSGVDMISGDTGGLSGTAAGGASGAGGVDTGELPRQQADPKLTHRLVAGRAALEGDTYDSCSNAIAAQGDRWCAFSRVVSDTDTRTELWVLNFTKTAASGTVAACDGTSPDCLLLSRDLWVGFQIWGDSQPVVHRFEGDTLIFHAGPAPGMRDPYEGGIWAWRPGWQQARLLTDHGVFCFGNPRSASIACVANAKIDKDPSDPFSIPYHREFDLVAGVLGDQEGGAGMLPNVAHVTHAPNDLNWRLRFSPNGEYLAYSSVGTLGAPEILKVVMMSDPGSAQAAPVLTDVAEWEIAHDGKSIYFLAGYDRSQGTAATGTLKVADFPTGANGTELTTMVRSFQLVGAFDQVFKPEDRGLVAVTSVPGGQQPILMLHPRAPADVFALDPAAVSVEVASDLRHSTYFKSVLGNPLIMVTHNDGSSACQLTADSKAESYAAGFTPSAASVVWIERLRRGTRSEQGWRARPEDCGARIQFGDHVLDYQLAGDDFVVFQGSDATSSSWWLEYTRLHGNADGSSPLPTVIKEHPDVNVHVISDAAGAWIVFSVLPQATEPEPGLYVHGPLQP